MAVFPVVSTSSNGDCSRLHRGEVTDGGVSLVGTVLRDLVTIFEFFEALEEL